MGLFKSDTVSISHDISVVYSPASGQNIIELVCNNPNQIKSKFGLDGVFGVSNGLLDELRCYASISSLPDIGFPDITAEDSESAKITKAQSYEWGTARFELVVFKKAKNSVDWSECGVSALKNAGGFRYRLHRILDLVTDNIGARVGEWGRIGVSVRSVGYGLPAAFDRITFTGSWQQEFTWVQEHPTYVIVNSYGGGSPSPTPTPTPTVTPTFTLSLGQGKTSVVANNDEQIILTITDVPAAKGISGTWLKDGQAVAATESISTSSSNIHILSSSKLAQFGAGNYSLRLTYEGVEYTTNAVSVILVPKVSLAITATQSGDLSFFVVDGQTYEFSIQGNYFVPGAATFVWYRGSSPATVSPSPGTNNPITGSLTVGSNGSFTLNKSTSNATFTSAYDTTNKEGVYKIRITQNGVSYESNTIQGAHKASSIGLPSSLSMSGGGSAAVTITGFSVGDTLTTIWLKDGVELAGTTTQHTYAENGGNSFIGFNYAFSVPASAFASSPYGGAGSYKLKVSRPNTPIKFTSAGSMNVTA